MGTANQLIEEFMLLANKRVAEYVGKKLKGKTFVYRIHDKPDPEKVTNFIHFITSSVISFLKIQLHFQAMSR
jgi:exoribonuclease R